MRHNGGVAHEDSITRTLKVEIYKPQRDQVRAAAMPWWAAAIGGALVCAVAVWAIIAAVALLSQLAQEGSVTSTPMDFATRFWLLAHGGILTLAGSEISLIPLGVTGIVALALHGAGEYAAKQVLLSVDKLVTPGVTVAKVSGVVAAVYAVVVIGVALFIDMGGPALRAAGGAFILALVMAFFGAKRALDWAPQKAWPMWTRAIPKAAMAAMLVCLLGGVVSFVASLVAHKDQFIAMTNQLQPGGVGGIGLVLLQLAFIVNIIVWCASWTTGAGFTLGDGSLVTLVGSHVGMLPSIPVSAVIPAPVGSWWNLAWLAFPVAAGMVAAVVVLRARQRARFDETALVGGLSGVLGGACFTVFAALSCGGLGVGRLSFLGPHLATLLVLSSCLMGISGVIAGLIMGLLRGSVGEPDIKWWAHWRSEKVDVPTLYKPQPAAPVWIVPEDTVAVGDKDEAADKDKGAEEETGEVPVSGDSDSLSSSAEGDEGKAAPLSPVGRFARFLHRGTRVKSNKPGSEPSSETADAANESTAQINEPAAEESLTKEVSGTPDATDTPEPPDDQPPLDFFSGQR